MPKPACAKCGLFFRPKRNGQVFEEGKPHKCEKDTVRFAEIVGFSWDPRGEKPPVAEKKEWTSYKLWNGDLWECRGCGAEILVGVVGGPMAEHYQEGYEEMRTRYGGDSIPFIHDC